MATEQRFLFVTLERFSNLSECCRLIDDIFNGPPSPKHNAAYNAWYWGGSLVAVDFGKPHGLDKTNLDTVGPYDEFSSGKFTAHSRVLKEKDGSLRMCCFR